jgi:hypothetical protein
MLISPGICQQAKRTTRQTKVLLKELSECQRFWEKDQIRIGEPVVLKHLADYSASRLKQRTTENDQLGNEAACEK